MANRYDDHDEIVQWLIDHIEQVAADLAPEGRRKGGDYRWGGSKGNSHSIKLVGPFRGRYLPFAEGAPHAMGIIDAIAAILGMGEGKPARLKAFDWARHTYGLGSARDGYTPPTPEEQRRAREQRAAKAEKDRKIELQKLERDRTKAHQRWQRAEPIAGLQPYLAKGRGIYLSDSLGLPRWPISVRYMAECPLPGLSDGSGPVPTGPAIVAALRGPWVTQDGSLDTGAFMSVQCTYLNPADPTRKADFDMPKRNVGPTRGGSIHLTTAAATLNVCEGLENGLSLMMLLELIGEPDAAVWVATGTSFLQTMILPPLPLGKRIRIWADHDKLTTPKAGQPYRAGQKAAEALRDKALAEGRDVEIIYPGQEEGFDWNDLVRSTLADDELRHILRWQIVDSEKSSPAATPDEPGEAEEGDPGPSEPSTALASQAPFDGADDGSYQPSAAELAQRTRKTGTGFDLEGLPTDQRLGKLQLEYAFVLSLNAFVHIRTNQVSKKDALNDYAKDVFQTGLGNILVGSPSTIRVEAMTFWPGKPKVVWDIIRKQKLCLNAWDASLVVPKEGDVSMFLNHLRVFFREDEDAIRHMLHWMAVQVQQPGVKIQWAPLLISLEGAGKSWLGNLMREILGWSNTTEIEGQQLEGSFSDWAKNTQFALVEEMSVNPRDAAKVMDRLKTMVTSPVLQINPKGTAAYEIPNRMNMMLLSNRLNAAVLAGSDRRFFVFANMLPPLGADYMAPLWSWLRSGEASAAVAWHLLRKVDLSAFNPLRPAPMTQAKLDMIETSQDETSFEIRAAMEANEMPFMRDCFTAEQVIAECLVRNKNSRLNQKSVTTFFRQLGAVNLGQIRDAITGTRPRVWCHRRVELWRQAQPQLIHDHMKKPRVEFGASDPFSKDG